MTSMVVMVLKVGPVKEPKRRVVSISVARLVVKPGIVSSPFVYLMVEIISHGSKNVHTATSFKILNDIAVCTPLDL